MPVTDREQFQAERAAMVELQLRSRGIVDERVLDAMMRVPRHEFVAPSKWDEAYADRPLAIGENQTTSQPYMIAAMLQAGSVRPEDSVLEVGTGSGYQTALLAELAKSVFSIERYPALVESARQILQRLGYMNVTVVEGDGSLGLPQHSPYDVIIVSAAAPAVPPALVQQLARHGRLLVPVGNASDQVLKLVRRIDGAIDVRTMEGCRFVPLVGEQGFNAD